LTELRRAESGGGPRTDGAPVETEPAAEGAGDEAVVAEASAAETGIPEAGAAEAGAPEVGVAEAAGADAAAAEATAPEPGETAPAGADPAAPQGRVSNRARLVAAIGRVGGPEIVRGVLQPKRDGQGQPLKWAAACCQAAQGLKPGDPAFNAWVRLAATPVREIKAEVAEPRDDRGGRSGRGGRRGGDRREAPRGDRAGGRRDRDRPSAEDMAAHAQGGRVGPSVRITTSAEDAERRERERQKKKEREAKRIAERERLRRIGY
jgi:hypothetical protein